ncbi:aldo/keto reductase [Microbacterium laevaniformans]|uniref:Aldo/keto reductase n=1 Tax=Microbacterium laevaniformans TaxID=36807 RepID=A0A4V6RDI8_9MICO|nr:aldo/keto reductase [Microbacterium laevaniformans]TGY32930.1 aldo/keto reductase [Microbacterium laevaniformans]
MQHGHLGRSGVLVSRLALGTMNFGMTADENQSAAVMDAAIDSGVTFFDTADVYGGPQSPDMTAGYGISEEIVGRWLKRTGRRDDIVLATKVYQPMGAGPNDRRLSAFHIRRACEASLRRLQTDHIDLYQMHHVDRSTPWEEVWQAMDQLVREGKITYVGSSNFAGWDIATAQGHAARHGGLGLVSEQSIYNLSERSIEREVVPAAEYHGVGILPWSPLDGGLLAGAPDDPRAGRRGGDGAAGASLRAERLRPQLTRWVALCRELGEPAADVAVAWLLGREAVSAVLVGSRTREQLRASLHALDVTLDADALRAIDAIWPGPGAAPEAYAW